MVRHTIRLEGAAATGARVSIHVLRTLSDALVNTAQRSLRLRVEGRSNLQSRASWLEAATDIQLVGLSQGSTVLELEAPTLGEAAPELFQQLTFPEFSPRRDQSAFSLVEDALRDATAGNEESDWLDRNILDALVGFRHLLGHGFDAITFDGVTPNADSVRVTVQGLGTVEHLRQEAPPPQATIVSGHLDTLVGSKRAFHLLLTNGQRVRGLLPPGDPTEYAPLFNKKVVVDGEARFKVSGALSLISATNIQPASEGDAQWEQLPRPRPRALSDLRPRIAPPSGSNGMDRVFGKWPGNESDAEILAALAAIE